MAFRGTLKDATKSGSSFAKTSARYQREAEEKREEEDRKRAREEAARRSEQKKQRDTDGGLLGQVAKAVGELSAGANETFLKGGVESAIGLGSDIYDFFVPGTTTKEAEQRKKDISRKIYGGTDENANTSALTRYEGGLSDIIADVGQAVQGKEATNVRSKMASDEEARRFAETNKAYRVGQAIGTGERIATDIATSVLPGAAAEKALRGTRAFRNLENKGSLGSIIADIAGSVGGGLASTGVGAVKDPRQTTEDIASGEIAKSLGLDAVLGAAGGGASALARLRRAGKATEDTTKALPPGQQRLQEGEVKEPEVQRLQEPGDRFYAPEREELATKRADIEDRLTRLQNNDMDYMRENQLTTINKDDGRLKKVMTDNADKAKAQEEAIQQAIEAEQQVKQYNDMRLSSPYHRQVDRIDAKKANELEQLDQLAAEQGADPQLVDSLRADIEARYQPQYDRLAQKYPQDAAEKPILDQAQQEATRVQMEANARVQQLADEQNNAYKLAAGELETPDIARLQTHQQDLQRQLDEVNAREQEITNNITAARERAAKPVESINRAADIDQEIADLQAGVHPLRTSGNNREAIQRFKDLNQKKADLEAEKAATTLPKATQTTPSGKKVQTPDERASVLRDAEEVLEVPNERKNFLLDLFELPTEFMRFRGLGNAADKVEDATMSYRRANYDDLSEIKDWKKKAKGNSTKDLFHAANGNTDAYAKLTPGGKEVVDNWRSFAQKAAEELGLPKDRRITDYIPHLFVKGGRENVPKLIDLDSKIAKAIDKVDNGGLQGRELGMAKSRLKRLQERRANLLDTNSIELQKFLKDKGDVRNQFLERRMGAEGYEEDFWKAVQLYTMQKNRKLHIEPASKLLVNIADKTAKADMKSWLVDYADQLRGGKNGLDKAMDDWFNANLGGKNVATRGLSGYRNISSLSKLGFNAGSIVNSTMQAINVAPVIGARAATEGNIQAMALLAKMGKNKLTGEETELIRKMRRDGVFEGSSQILPDETMSKYGTAFNETAYAGIKAVDRYLRMTTWLGAYRKGQREGITGQALDRYAYRMSNKVNQNFDQMVVPKAFRSQVARSLGSMVTFAPGQLVRAGEVAASGLKGAGRLASGRSVSQKTIRADADRIAKSLYLAAGGYMMGSIVGSVTGNSESIPNPLMKEFWSTPALDFLVGTETKAGILGLLPSSTDKQGEEGEKGDHQKRVEQFFGEVLPTFLIPGYAQANKTFQGMGASERGYSVTSQGNIRFATDPENDLQRSIFGQWSTPEAREYVRNMNRPGGGALSATASDKVRSAPPGLEDQYLRFYQAANEVNGRSKANKDITSLIQNGEVEKAKRKAAEFNAKVDEAMGEFYADYPDLDEDLIDELNSNMYINLTSRGIKQRAKYD